MGNKNPYDNLVWEFSTEVARIAHIHYGIELTVSEVCVSMHKDVGYDSHGAFERLYLLTQDPREMKKWLQSMAPDYRLAFRIHWGAWIGLAAAWFVVALFWR